MAQIGTISHEALSCYWHRHVFSAVIEEIGSRRISDSLARIDSGWGEIEAHTTSGEDTR